MNNSLTTYRRRGGIALIAGALLTIAAAVLSAIVEGTSSVPDDLVRYPFSHHAFVPFTVFAAACHLLMLAGVVYLARGRLAADSKTGRIGLAVRDRRSDAAVRVRMAAAAIRRSAHVEHRTDDRRFRVWPGHSATRGRHDRGRRRNPPSAELGFVAPVRTADLRPAVTRRDPDPVHIRPVARNHGASAPATWSWAWRRSAMASAAPTTRFRLRDPSSG